MTRWAKSWRRIGVAGIVAGVAATAGTHASATEATPQARGGAKVGSTSAGGGGLGFGFVYAVHSLLGSGYDVFGANGEAFPWCGSYSYDADPDGLGPHCHVTSIDFGPMGLQPEGVGSVMKDVRSYDSASYRGVRLLFAGVVTNGVLQVWETWRSPSYVPTWAPLYSVSHQDKQTLVLNMWTPTTLPTITMDPSYTPEVYECTTTPGGTCPVDGGVNENGTPIGLVVPTMEMTDAAGIILTGQTMRSGRRTTFGVTDYFVLISTGHSASNDGYSYCLVGQVPCGDHLCTFTPPSCPGTHGRIRGLIDNPNLSTEAGFQSWMYSVGLVNAGDLAP